jgi:hypothetical protein
MVFTRSIPRLVRPAYSLFAAAGRSSPLTSRGASLLRQRHATPQIRTVLTSPRKKVKVLLVLYDGQLTLTSLKGTSIANWSITGGQHANDVPELLGKNPR